MTRALVLLACAAAAAATRYADYGAKMPQYAAEYEAAPEPAPASDDYHGHAPDASAALDYKYEEEHHSKSDKPSKIVDDAEMWRKVRRKQRGVQRPERSDLDALDTASEEDEDASRPRPSSAHARRRPRLRDHDEEPPAQRRSAKYSRDRKIEVSGMKDIDRDDFPEDKNEYFEENVNFVSKDTTRRGKRRKPRDRSLKKIDDDESPDDDILVADRRVKVDDAKESEYPVADAERRRRPDERDQRERYRPVLDDDDDDQPRPDKKRPKSYNDYSDYYDMKRVQNIKQKLPGLLRRTSTEKLPMKTMGEMRRIHKLWTNRRLGVVPAVSITPAPSDSDSAEIVDVGTPILAVSALAQKAKSIEISTNTPTKPTASTMAPPEPATEELSFAEKSRLSILKKVQRKDGVKDEATKKPPVLLQVTQKLATVVIVEPPVSRPPWMQQHELTGDSPERLDRVKKLMRHKLVAQAKNIQELTDNWDEMVCDYIDVALLDSAPRRRGPPARALLLLSLVIIIM